MALLLTSCGSQQSDESGAVTPDTVKQLEDLLHARASAMAKGDRNAFLQTVDATRPTFRRIQLREFELPSARGTLNSTFKISNAERYRGYIRGFVEETLEGNAFVGAFNGGRAYARRYFRAEAGKWLLTEPTGDETGREKKLSAGDVEATYWEMDEDVAPVFLAALSEARGYAVPYSPKPQPLILHVSFVPTAELAGPGWDGFSRQGGQRPQRLFYPLWYAFDSTRTHLSAYAQYALRTDALDEVREGVAPGVAGRLFTNRWLDHGWLDYASGLDMTVTLKQSCAGVPIPSLQQLADGAPELGQPGVSPETHGRHYAFSASMVAYLYEKYGVDAFWRLMTAFVKNSSATSNFPAILQVTPDEFYASWLIWLKKKYC